MEWPAVNAINAGNRVYRCGSGRVCYTRPMKQGLYANINRRKKLGISRPKSESTIKPRVWKLMKAKKGGFETKQD